PRPDANDQRGDRDAAGRSRDARSDRRHHEARHESPDGAPDPGRFHRPGHMPLDPPRPPRGLRRPSLPPEPPARDAGGCGMARTEGGPGFLRIRGEEMKLAWGSFLSPASRAL